MLSILGRCVEVMVDVVDCPGSSWVVGQALVYVGLTLSHLLAPKGPVDPVQKATVKLNHFRQEVGCLMWNSCLHDIYMCVCVCADSTGLMHKLLLLTVVVILLLLCSPA